MESACCVCWIYAEHRLRSVYRKEMECRVARECQPERALSPTQLVHNIVFADLDLLIFQQQRRLRATLYYDERQPQVH
jgi:hypothetical protein